MKLLFDFFPILLFFIAYKVYGIFPATAVAIAASFVQVGAFWLKHRRFETMHLVTLALIVVLGGLTLLFHDRTFFMWKPSIVNWLFAAAFLGSRFVGEKTVIERMMGHAIPAPVEIWRRLNLAWVTFFVLMGVANLYVADIFFRADAALVAAVGHPVPELSTCAQQFTGQLLSLCQAAKQSENDWVNFKLFGMMGATFAFVIAQAFYLARHMPEEDTAAEES